MGRAIEGELDEGPWFEEKRKLHINCLELLAVLRRFCESIVKKNYITHVTEQSYAFQTDPVQRRIDNRLTDKNSHSTVRSCLISYKQFLLALNREYRSTDKKTIT